MYYQNRTEAGQILADKLFEAYRYENCAVVALTSGAVLVGEQIAERLHCVLTMMMVEAIEVPGENLNFGGVSQGGNFSYNSDFSQGQIDGFESEFHGYFEEQKREAFQRINRLLGEGGVIDKDLLRDHTIILVSDGVESGASFDAAMDFLKPIRTDKIIVATPTASVPAVDKLHMMADELHILDVKANFMGVDHYYEENDIPSEEDTIEKINKIVLNWQ
ncbi:MAG: hypothetical protein L0H36_02855 [bacterium]|nr:hypothetical protein [bacterium]MDN5835549.1 hypothetical protein [bacterium]